MKFLGNLNRFNPNYLILIFLLMLFNSSTSISQTRTKIDSSQFFLEIGSNIAFPLGDLSSKDLSSKKSGYGNTGLSLNAFYGCHGKKNIGMKIGLGINIFGYDKSSDTIFDYVNIPTGYIHEVDYGRWWFTNFYIGPNYQIKTEDLVFDFTLLTGISFSRRPSIEHRFYKTQNESSPATYKVFEGEGTSFIFKPELAVYFPTGKKTNMKISASYTYSNPTIRYQERFFNYYWSSNKTDKEINMKLSWVEFGIALMFNK